MSRAIYICPACGPPRTNNNLSALRSERAGTHTRFHSRLYRIHSTDIAMISRWRMYYMAQDSQRDIFRAVALCCLFCFMRVVFNAVPVLFILLERRETEHEELQRGRLPSRRLLLYTHYIDDTNRSRCPLDEGVAYEARTFLCMLWMGSPALMAFSPSPLTLHARMALDKSGHGRDLTHALLHDLRFCASVTR